MNNKKTKKTLKKTLFYTVLAGSLFLGSNTLRNTQNNPIIKEQGRNIENILEGSWNSETEINGKRHILWKSFSDNELKCKTKVIEGMYHQRKSEYEILNKEGNNLEIMEKNQNGLKQKANISILSPNKISIQYQRPTLIDRIFKEELPEVTYERE